MGEIELTKLNPTEKKRTYFFPKGEKVEIDDVVEFLARPSGSHRLKSGDGKLYIVSSGWLYIEIDVAEFSF